jgi:hypothetical protein
MTGTARALSAPTSSPSPSRSAQRLMRTPSGRRDLPPGRSPSSSRTTRLPLTSRASRSSFGRSKRPPLLSLVERRCVADEPQTRDRPRSRSRLPQGCVASPRGARVGVEPLSGRDCWPQGQPQLHPTLNQTGASEFHYSSRLEGATRRSDRSASPHAWLHAPRRRRRHRSFCLEAAARLPLVWPLAALPLVVHSGSGPGVDLADVESCFPKSSTRRFDSCRPRRPVPREAKRRRRS